MNKLKRLPKELKLEITSFLFHKCFWCGSTIPVIDPSYNIFICPVNSIFQFCSANCIDKFFYA